MSSIADSNIVIQQSGHVRNIQSPKERPVHADQMATVVEKEKAHDKESVQETQKTEEQRLDAKKKKEEEEKKEKRRKKRRALRAAFENAAQAEEAPEKNIGHHLEDAIGGNLDTVV